MNIIRTVSLLFILTSTFVHADDSTNSVAHSLTQAENFSSSSGNGTLIYNGATSGRINYSGFKQVSVNGFTHQVGKGYVTRVPIMPAQYVTAYRCEDGCRTTKFTATVPPCTMIITDTYAQGCNVDTQIYTDTHCYTSSNDRDYCSLTNPITYKYSGIIYSAIGDK